MQLDKIRSGFWTILKNAIAYEHIITLSQDYLLKRTYFISNEKEQGTVVKKYPSIYFYLKKKYKSIPCFPYFIRYKYKKSKIS